jgi:hypothetical protein
MTTKTDADVFHAWAVREGLFAENVTKPVTVTAAEVDTISPTADPAKDILRKKAIQRIFYNEATHVITVLTRRAKPTKKEMAVLPKTVGESSIQYRQGVVDDVGGLVPKSHGKPFHIVLGPEGDCYACGSSISLGNCQDAGTLGALVRDAGGVLYGLSNNHVTGGCNHAQSQMPILAPGVLDVSPMGFDPITIGYHERGLDMVPGIPGAIAVNKNLDAALFKIRDEARVSSMQGSSYDTPSNVRAIKPNMNVEKVGRTTGHTKGIVRGQAQSAFAIHYALTGVGYSFTSQVYFDPLFVIEGSGESFSEEGDSGSLVTYVDDTSERQAVGLIVGGLKGGVGTGYSLVLPIESILNALGVELVSGHNI